MITLQITIPQAEKYIEALTIALQEGNLHSDEATELEEIRDRLDAKVEAYKDWHTDVEAAY